jgi:hypothetical protein
MPAEQVGGGQQAPLGGPGQEDLAHRALVLDLQVDDRPRHRLRRSGARRGHHGHAQADRDEAADVGQVVALEDDIRPEPGLLAQVVGQPPQRGGRPQADERLASHLGQADLPPPGQRVLARQGQTQRLEPDQPSTRRLVRGPPRAEFEVGVTAVQGHRVRVVAHLDEQEADAGVRDAEAADQVGDQPGAQRLLEGQRHRAGIGVDELADGGDAVVQLMQHRVQVRLEDRPGVGHAQRPAGAAQQRRADLRFQPGQGPGDAGLGDRLQLADLGHRGAVGDLLEPAQRVGIHTHDCSSCIHCQYVIGRIDAGDAHWKGATRTEEKKMTTSLLTAVRDQIRETREAHAARVLLERELAGYHSDADLNDLHAILDRYNDRETAQIRRILASQNSI